MIKKISICICAFALLSIFCFIGCSNSNIIGLPKVIKIGRTTCVPCVKMSKLLDLLKPKLEGFALVEVIDIDEDYDAINRFTVTGIPVTIFVNTQGVEMYRQIGLLEEHEILGWLEKAGMKK